VFALPPPQKKDSPSIKGNRPHRSETPLPYNKVISFLENGTKVARKFIQICVINFDLGFSYLNQRDVGVFG
jgi:hypothetical protein